MMARRVKFMRDPEGKFVEYNGEERPLTAEEYRECPYYCPGGAVVSYKDYLAYYGNPERHVYLTCVIEEQCEACGTWRVSDSLGWIDLMDDDSALRMIELGKDLCPEEAKKLPGELGCVASDLLRNPCGN